MTSQVTRYASVLDINLDSAELDLRFGFGRERPAASSLEYWARFRTGEPSERIRDMMTLVEKGCHSTNTTRADVPVIPHLRLNGEEIPYNPSGLPPDSVSVPADGGETFHVEVSERIIDTYWREGTSEGFTVNADEALARGGTSKAVPPLLYFLMGTGFEIGNQAIRSAAAIGYQIEHFTIEVETVYDMRGKAMLGDFYTGQLWFKYWLNLQSPESPDRALQLIDHLDRNCRATDTLRRPVPHIPHVVVTGQEIQYSLPALSSPEVVRAERGLEVDETVFRRGPRVK